MYVVGGVFAIFVLCILACHLGLRSLQQLRKQTHSINVNQLQKRLNLSNSSLEVELLSKDINHMLERIEKAIRSSTVFLKISLMSSVRL
jgi:two-component system heavy metal sensor histidine kinase CusS